MTLDNLPRLTRTEAEQVAEQSFKRWTGITGQPDPGVKPEAQADFVQDVERRILSTLAERSERGEGDAT